MKTILAVIGVIMVINMAWCDIQDDLIRPLLTQGNSPSVSYDAKKRNFPETGQPLLFQRSKSESPGLIESENMHVIKQGSVPIPSFTVDPSPGVPGEANSNDKLEHIDQKGTKVKDLTKYAQQGQMIVDDNEASTAEWGQVGQGWSTATARSNTYKDTAQIENELITERSSQKDSETDSDDFEDSYSDLESDSFNDHADTKQEARGRSWRSPPIDYFKCGKCVCHIPVNGTAVVANCQGLNIQKIPDNLSTETVSMNLHKNHVVLAFDRLSLYTSLLSLDVSSNYISIIQNNTCKDNLILHTLDLSNNFISTIHDHGFSCLPHLKNLYLQINHIQVLTNLMLGGILGLWRLDLSQNYLRSLETNAFDTSRYLRVLKLNNNKNLTYSAKVFSPRIFKPLKRLEVLHIQGFTKSNGKYPIAVLLELNNLKELSIDGLQIGKFETNLTALTNLSVLKIGVDGHCMIKNLSQAYFIGLPHLKSVHLSGCNLSDISPSVFQGNPVLEDLVYSEITYAFDKLFESFSGLQNTSIKSLSINFVRKNAKKTACRTLGCHHSQYMKNMKHLKELHLENNLISFIGYDFLEYLPSSLQKINLKKNTLHYRRSIIDTQGAELLKNLTEINEDMQNRAVILGDEEELHGISQTDALTCNSEAVYITPCKTIVRENYNTPISRKRSAPPNLEIYSAAQSFNFGNRLISRNTKKQNKIRYLNLSNSYITDWGIRQLPLRVEIADFSENFCDILKQSFFPENNSMEELHVAGNFLGETFSKDESGEILLRLGRLLYADFSRNHIRDLSFPFFEGLVQAQVIDLSENNIHSWNVNMSHMTNLRFLDLSQNSISWISKDSRDDLDFISTLHNITIDITMNRLTCTCAGLEVLQWLASTNVKILNKDYLKCENDQKKGILIGDMVRTVASLQRRCVHKTVLILSVTFSILFFLFVVLSAWMFRNRWRLHYLRNVAINKLFGYKPDNEVQEHHCNFDAYIVYSKDDVGFVMNECVDELERKRGHKLCLEHRDFLLGSYMPCTITSAINLSRMTIPLISPAFWDSEWGEYGVQMAVLESNHAKRDVLHLLIYKQVPVETMPRNLIKVLQDNSFCEYPPEHCEENVKRAFWDALSGTIGHVNPAAVAHNLK